MKLRALVRDLYGIDQPQGCTEEEIAAVREKFGTLPAVVEDFWRTFGRTPRLSYVQDDWMFPAFYEKWGWPKRLKDLSLLCENQYVYEAAVLQKDLSLPDPPVYIRPAADEGPWQLSSPTVSEFLEAALLYEAVWQLDHEPGEFYWLTEKELAVVQDKLTKSPAVLKNWFVSEITFYSNRPDNLVVIMDMEDGMYQASYGGATQESFDALMEVMEGLGEPI
ncbi:MAG: hypothetical protein HFF57_08790 [Lawsonibacter sp.]|jgi:hypothetical protein|nr:hypothetical protein [Lawsonibacter sp.]